MRIKINQKLKELESRPLRCLAVAYVDPPPTSDLHDIIDEKTVTLCSSLKNSTNFINLGTHSLIHSLTHSLTRSLTHSLAHSLTY